MTKWIDYGMHVLIPMAGAGSRFEKAGYTFPKPLIEVLGKPMIQRVVENLNIEGEYVFLTLQKHIDTYNLGSFFKLITSTHVLIPVDEIQQGAAVTTLLAKSCINDASPLIIANSDQLVEWDSTDFMHRMLHSNADAGIVVFNATHPKYSFAKVEEDDSVSEVAEKNPISDTATVGIYYWKHGSDYVKYAEQMISKDIRTNNEFYVCPVFNEAIQDGKKVMAYKVSTMHGLGTPEDLNVYLERYHDTYSS
jgi:dTDP-glucose pyrophosphorylase